MIERYSPGSWKRDEGVIFDTYVFQDVDGHAIAEYDEGTYAEKRRIQWRLPVLIGTRGGDAFWWYRNAAYRCTRGLAWWDVEAMAPNARAGPVRALDTGAGGPVGEPGTQVRRTVQAAVEHVRRHGVSASAERVRERLRPLIWLTEAHVWSVLRLDEPHTPRPLPDGLDLRLGDEGDVPLLRDVPTELSPREADRRLADGAQLWLVRDGDRLAFACWIFTDFAPVLAAPRSRFRIPPRHVVLEDSATADSYRGRGIAPAAWLAIADKLRREGYARMLTKIELDNRASRRAVEKAGFREAAIVSLRRVFATNHVVVREVALPETARMLRDRLG